MLPSSKRDDWDNDTAWITSYDDDLMGDKHDSSFASNHLEFSKFSQIEFSESNSSNGPGTKQAFSIFLLKE